MTDAARDPRRSEPRGSRLSPETVAYVRDTLPHVSRTFALTIPLLREPLRDEVGLAYLLCRVADTIEDHPSLDEEGRDRALDAFAAALHLAEAPRDLTSRLPRHPEPHHDALLRRAPRLLDARRDLRIEARRAVDACLWDMARGMTRFPGRRSDRLVHACRSLEGLEAYCHVVAGTVGHLLTDLFTPWFAAPPGPAIRERGRRFGLGLQLTNVLKDVTEDAVRGVSYLPPPESTTDGLAPRRDRVARLALDHLDAGEIYVRDLPAGAADLRLFCLWALHLALATLSALVAADPAATARASRGELAAIQEETRAAVSDDAALRALYARRSASLRAALRPDAAALLGQGGIDP